MCLRIYKLFLFIPSNLIRLILRDRYHIPILQMRERRLRELKLLTWSHMASNISANSYLLVLSFQDTLLLTPDKHKGERFVALENFLNFKMY